MPAYKATQKTVKCLELVVKYLDSAASRLTDDEGMQSSKDVVAFCRDILQSAADAENATRISAAAVVAPAVIVADTAAAEATAAAAFAEREAIERQQAEMLAEVEARLAEVE
jgi:hypothetical protein